MIDLVYDSDNGLITLALQTYIRLATEMEGEQRLIDRATELEIIFKNKSVEEKYEWPET